MIQKTTIFYMSGIAMMLTIGLIKYVIGGDFSIFSILIYFAYGGAVGILATTKHTSFIKNIVFASVFFVLLWMLLLPVLNISDNNWIVRKNEIILLIILGLMFVEREFWNALAVTRGKKPRAMLTFFGTILLLILSWTTEILDLFWAWWAENWWFSLLFLAIWWPFLIWAVIKAIMRDVKGLKIFIKKISRK